MKTIIKSISFIYCFALMSEVHANTARNLVDSIKNRGDVSCHWVENVGDTNIASNVQFIEIGSAMCDVRDNRNGGGFGASGFCKGHIRCAGYGGGWGDIYFENVHCPGVVALGQLACGRGGDSNEANRDFSEGIKSCLVSYILNDGSVINDGANQVIRQTPRSQAVE